MFCCISLSFIYSLGYRAVFSNPAVQLFSCKCVIIKLSLSFKLTVYIMQITDNASRSVGHVGLFSLIAWHSA